MRKYPEAIGESPAWACRTRSRPKPPSASRRRGAAHDARHNLHRSSSRVLMISPISSAELTNAARCVFVFRSRCEMSWQPMEIQ